MSDPYIKEAAALMDQAKDALSGGADKVKGMTENVDVQKLLPYLLAGGAGAVGGAALSGRRKERAGETRGQYLTRILRNAVAAAALTGAGSYAATKGFQKTLGKVDLEHPITGTADDQGPAAAAGRRFAFGYPAAGIAGTAGLVATAGGKFIGANPNAADAGEELLEALKRKTGGLPTGADSVKGLKGLSKTDPASFQYLLGELKDADGKVVTESKELRQLAQRAGFNTHDPAAVTKVFGKELTGVRSKLHTAGKLPSALLGRSPLRRAGRAGIFGVSALIPAVVGSILSNRPE